MRNSRSLLAILVVGLSLLAMPAWAAYPLTSDIAGVVVDADQKPIKGAKVIIHHLDTGRVVVRTTNAKGRYIAPNVRSDGRYQITVVADQGAVTFRPGTLLLGERMRRNAVLGADAYTPPDFMRSWQWRQPASLMASP